MSVSSKDYMEKWKLAFEEGKVPERSLNEWALAFEAIYGKQNEKKTESEILLRLVEEVGELAEDMRKMHVYPKVNSKNEVDGILINIADIVAWLSALARRYGSLDDMVWQKYPQHCGHCGRSVDCICIAQTMSDHDRLKLQAKIEKWQMDRQYMPVTMGQWQDMFDRLYGKVNAVQSLELVGFHLMEETAEVAQALRYGAEVDLRSEIADVFAWVCAVCVRYRALGRQDTDFRLDRIIWARFQDKCPHCAQSECSPVCRPGWSFSGKQAGHAYKGRKELVSKKN